MAVDPDKPFNREEMYLAKAAGEGTVVPDEPWSRKEAYLEKISGRMDDMDDKIAALVTDFSYKGSVPTYDDLPSSPEIGDVYTIEDTGFMYVWDGSKWVALNMSGQEIKQSDWDENDSADPAYIKNRTHYSETVENIFAQYSSTSAGATPDSNYVWFVEKVEGYSTETDLSDFSDGDVIKTTFIYSVNGAERQDTTELILAIENGHYNLDSDTAPAGSRWRGAYLSELDGDTTFRWPVATADASATVYLISIRYEKVKELDAKYIPIDGDTLKVNASGKIEADVQGGPVIVQETGTSTADVMSQNATSKMIFKDPVTKNQIGIGNSTYIGGGAGIVIGSSSQAQGYNNGIVIGHNSYARSYGSIAIGNRTEASGKGVVSIGILQGYGQNNGYNDSVYRLLTGLYDPQNDHDAATKGYVDAAIAALRSELGL